MWISPTRLAAALAGSGATPEATHGCVIVETNYRVSAETHCSSAVGVTATEALVPAPADNRPAKTVLTL